MWGFSYSVTDGETVMLQKSAQVEELFRERNVEGLIGLYAEDAILMLPGVAPLEGRDGM